jgi:hypothetical protein
VSTLVEGVILHSVLYLMVADSLVMLSLEGTALQAGRTLASSRISFRIHTWRAGVYMEKGI